MEPWSNCEGAWADLGLYCPYVLEDMFIPITWLCPWILSIFLWTLYYILSPSFSCTYLYSYDRQLHSPSFKCFFIPFQSTLYLSWSSRLSGPWNLEILNQTILDAFYKLATWLPLMVRVCKSNIIFQSMWRPSICRSHKRHLLNHWKDFTQTCYMSSPVVRVCVINIFLSARLSCNLDWTSVFQPFTWPQISDKIW